MFEFTDAHASRYLREKQHKGSLFNETQLSVLIECITSPINAIVNAFWNNSLDRAFTDLSLLRRVNQRDEESDQAKALFMPEFIALGDLKNSRKILLAGMLIEPLFHFCIDRFKILKLERVGGALTAEQKDEIHSIVEEHLDLAIAALTAEKQKRAVSIPGLRRAPRKSERRVAGESVMTNQLDRPISTKRKAKKKKSGPQSVMFRTYQREKQYAQTKTEDSTSAKRSRLRSSAR